MPNDRIWNASNGCSAADRHTIYRMAALPRADAAPSDATTPEAAPFPSSGVRGDVRGCQRLDADFHRVIVESSGNPYLLEAYGQAWLRRHGGVPEPGAADAHPAHAG